ncbi:MAG: heparinase II/III family protein [Pirellulales bacterium]|nr:heparinase II/III family protein [Pirellulales bacterium]
MHSSIIRLCVNAWIAFVTAHACLAETTRLQIPSTFPAHPRLFTNPAEIAEFKSLSQRDPEIETFVHSLIERLESQVTKVPTPNPVMTGMENRAISTYARDMAIGYMLTDRREFADAAAQVLLSYAKVYPGYEVTETKGKAMPSTLNEARWAIDLATAYDLIFNSCALTEQQRSTIEQNVFIPCGEVLRICNHKTRSNWRARAIAGLGVIGFLIGNRDFIDEAINGYASENGKQRRNGFVQHLQYSILGDGIFYERSFGYQAYTTDSYFLLMEAARHSGVDLWNLVVKSDSRDAGADLKRQFGPPGSKTVKPIFDALFYRSFSDGAVTNVANATADHFVPRRYYEAAWRAWRDPKYAFAARLSADDNRPWDAKPTGRVRRLGDPSDILWIEPGLPAGFFSLGRNTRLGNSGIHKNGCTLFPNGGFAILRQSTDPDSVCVEMNFGNWGSGHSHPDKLSIVISDGQRKVIREANYFGYADDQYLTWDRQTIAHNTITVNETSQLPQGNKADPWPVPVPGTTVHGQPLFFHPGDTLKAFRADCTDAYPGIKLTRTIALVDSVVIDFYSATASSPHQYDYALHVDAPVASAGGNFQDFAPRQLSDHYGYRHIDFTSQGTSPFEASLQPMGRIHFFTPSTAILGRGIANKDGSRMAVILLRQSGTMANFVTAFDLLGNHTLTLEHNEGNVQSIRIDRNHILTNSPTGIELRTAGGKLIDRASPQSTSVR